MIRNENRFEKIVRICLTPNIFDLLGDESNNLLYCSKYITNLVIDHYIRNQIFILSIAKRMSEKKQQMMQHLFVDSDYSNLSENLKSISLRLRSLIFACDFNQLIEISQLPA